MRDIVISDVPVELIALGSYSFSRPYAAERSVLQFLLWSLYGSEEQSSLGIFPSRAERSSQRPGIARFSREISQWRSFPAEIS